ncbi:MAG: hypothetical protein ACJ79S_18560 [Gemmatimonadaceae bacterium]
MQATGARPSEAAAGSGETQERFLRELALRLPLDRLVEVHLFPAMRQGGVETGLAVIAARWEEARREPEPAPTEETDTDPEAAPHPDADPDPESAASAELAAAGEPGAAGEPEAGDAGVEGAPPRLQDAPPEDDPHNPPDAERTVHSSLPERHTVFSARYRLTLKGPDRGKWEVDVVEEADAPLVTVDAVVRGVQRRAGEGADPERFTADQLRALLPVDAPPPAPR